MTGGISDAVGAVQVNRECIGCGEHAGIDRVPCLAVVGSPSGRYRHIADLGTPGATRDARENHCADGDSGLGREVVECYFGGLGGVHHADAGHRHDDLLAAQRAEVEVMTVDHHGGVWIERGAGENGVGFGRKSGQNEGALFGLAAGVGEQRLARRLRGGRCAGQGSHCGLELASRESQQRPHRRCVGGRSRRATGGERTQDRVDDPRHQPAHDTTHVWTRHGRLGRGDFL